MVPSRCQRSPGAPPRGCPPAPTNSIGRRPLLASIDEKKRHTGNNYEGRWRWFLAVRGQVSHVVGGRPPVLLSTLGDPDGLATRVTDNGMPFTSARGADRRPGVTWAHR
jgi:hypothetical protein